MTINTGSVLIMGSLPYWGRVETARRLLRVRIAGRPNRDRRPYDTPGWEPISRYSWHHGHNPFAKQIHALNGGTRPAAATPPPTSRTSSAVSISAMNRPALASLPGAG